MVYTNGSVDDRSGFLDALLKHMPNDYWMVCSTGSVSDRPHCLKVLQHTTF